MQQSFQSASRRLVFVSDISGTLTGPQFEGGFNDHLFDLLIEARLQNHWAIFTMNGGSVDPFKVVGDLIRDKLKERAQREDLFNVAEGYFNAAIQPAVPKRNLQCFLGRQCIEQVDYIFDDNNIYYLDAHMVGQHIAPSVFYTDDAPSRDMLSTISNRVHLTP